MLFKSKPKKFTPRFEVVSCFCEHNGEILLLKRQSEKPQGNKWGVPAGKRESMDNSIRTALIREIKEETGMNIDQNLPEYFRHVFVRYVEFDFIYHMFHLSLQETPNIEIRENEHLHYTWVTPEKALNMDLIEDLDKCIRLFYFS